MYQLRRNLYNFKDYMKPNHIIITHSQNLIDEKYQISNLVRKHNNKYTWDIWQEYCQTYLNFYMLPMNCYFDYVGKDYAAFMGLDITRYSYFLDVMEHDNVIEPGHKNDYLIVLGDNLQYDVPNTRMYEMLVDRVLSPLFHQFDLHIDDVYCWDEILTDEFIARGEDTTPSGFNYVPMTNWDSLRLSQAVMKLHREKLITRKY